MLNSLRISPHNLRHLLPILKQHNSRHSPHTKFLRHIRHSINIHLVEFRLRVLLAELLDHRRDGFAGAAPGCPAVEDDGAGVAEDFLQEVGFTVLVWGVSWGFVLVGMWRVGEGLAL